MTQAGSFRVHQSFPSKREGRGQGVLTCRDHTQHGCRSRAITQGRRVTQMRGHSPRARPGRPEGPAAAGAGHGGAAGPAGRPRGPRGQAVQGGIACSTAEGPGPLTPHQAPAQEAARAKANDEDPSLSLPGRGGQGRGPG